MEPLGVSPCHQGDVCDICWDIPWEKLTSTFDRTTCDLEPFVLGDRKQLKASTCPVCRFLGLVTEEHDINVETASLRWCDVTANSQDVATVSLHGVRDGNQPRPHFIVTSLGLDAVHSRLEHIYPQKIDIDLVKSWLTECDRDHDACKSDRTSEDDLSHAIKLIDCVARKVVPGNLTYSYATLSYCWGSSQTRGEGFPFDDSCFQLEPCLPATIEDSIVLTKALGIQYLWVDRYCINQDDAKGKHEQIQMMGDIYAASQLTMIAAAGSGPDHGLPGVNARIRRKPIHASVRAITLVHLPPRSTIWSDISNSQWANRAWTYQECFLSRKRLAFTDAHAGYVCNVGAGRESNLFGLASKLGNHMAKWPLANLIPSLNSDPEFLNDLMDVLAHACVQATRYLAAYSMRSLTFDSDALNAITGALKSLNKRCSNIKFVWGMPMFEGVSFDHLDRRPTCPDRFHIFDIYIPIPEPGILNITLGLFWYHSAPCRRRPGFPSWSSLGWEGRIDWVSRRTFDSLVHANGERGYGAIRPPSPVFAYVTIEESRMEAMQIPYSSAAQSRDDPHINDFINDHNDYMNDYNNYISDEKNLHDDHEDYLDQHHDYITYYDDYIKNHRNDHLNNQSINVLVEATPLRLVSEAETATIRKQDGGVVKTRAIALTYDLETEVLVEPRWDLTPWSLDDKTVLKGILLDGQCLDPRSSDRSTAIMPSISWPLLIVRQTEDDRYERIGLFWLPLRENFDECCVHHLHEIERGTAESNTPHFDNVSGFTIAQQRAWFDSVFTPTRIHLD
ncbi:heterokaryon incompatibility protein-domain-containing protein [Paraphoma chrysanthemicola]|uniref:Heterokaryon incompatibility protein-domain-containing protein n=1 Tax=Paraphoma chrysanthemicola TaxID=798071 RepID=A0A8K0VRT8_9PLEO|nr:heterokaryon incompatibility protein-domain-containing protein [Paraphoma chrysanthemicola]